jgi:hypothetical protein
MVAGPVPEDGPREKLLAVVLALQLNVPPPELEICSVRVTGATSQAEILKYRLFVFTVSDGKLVSSLRSTTVIPDRLTANKRSPLVSIFPVIASGTRKEESCFKSKDARTRICELLV